MRLLHRQRKIRDAMPSTNWVIVEFSPDFPSDPERWPTLRNVGREAVHAVRIDPIRRGRFCAIFPSVAALDAGGSPVPLRPITTRDGERDDKFSECRNDWFAALFSHDTRNMHDSVVVPLHIHFLDVHNRPHAELQQICFRRPGMHFEARA